MISHDTDAAGTTISQPCRRDENWRWHKTTTTASLNSSQFELHKRCWRYYDQLIQNRHKSMMIQYARSRACSLMEDRFSNCLKLIMIQAENVMEQDTYWIQMFHLQLNRLRCTLTSFMCNSNTGKVTFDMNTSKQSMTPIDVLNALSWNGVIIWDPRHSTESRFVRLHGNRRYEGSVITGDAAKGISLNCAPTL